MVGLPGVLRLLVIGLGFGCGDVIIDWLRLLVVCGFDLWFGRVSGFYC